MESKVASIQKDPFQILRFLIDFETSYARDSQQLY